MTDVSSSVIARLKKQDHVFEILVDCEKAMDFKSGNASLDDVVVTTDIFKDIKKGEHASEHDIENMFGTTDDRKVAEIILKKGEVQLTTEYKNRLREQKRKQIITLIARNSVDPKTNLPHPPQRIENALNEAKININEFKSADEQVKDIVKQITGVLPIKYEIKVLSIKIPADVTGQSYPILKRFGNLLKEDWLNDGSLNVTAEVPAGLQNELFDKLNSLAQGRVEVTDVTK
tara:strand:+ start:1401 stop:2096 length:696 start_codon:yes stop_codon:yes gene_type:complete